MRGLNPDELDLLRLIAAECRSGRICNPGCRNEPPPSLSTQAIARQLLADGRISVYRCAWTGTMHGEVTSSGAEAMRLTIIARGAP